MQRNLGRRIMGLVVWLSAAGLSAQACISFDTLCEEKIDCENGNDADIDACVVASEAEADRASLYGCTEWFEIFADCRESDSSCENDVYGLYNNDCEDEAREYGSCMGDNLPPAPF